MTYIAVVALREPGWVGDLLAYAGMIIRYARQFKGLRWQVYDMNFHLQATATKPHKWAEANGSLWAMAFGGVEWQKHCQTCSSLDHEESECPWRQEPGKQGKAKAPPPPSPRGGEANLHSVQL